MADPNWLLSTAVQAAAAFVAIIAGLIVSKLMALSAEKNSIVSKLKDADIELTNKRRELAVLEERLLRWDINDLLESDEILEKVVDTKGEISLKEAMTIYYADETPARSEDEIRPYWNNFVRTIMNAAEFYDKLSANQIKVEKDLNALINEHNPNLTRWEMKVYNRVIDNILDKRRQNYRDPFMIKPQFADIQFSQIRSIDETNQYRTLERDIEIMSRDVKFLEQQTDKLRTDLRYVGKPEGMTFGFSVLAYFSLVGILVPLLLLPMLPGQLTPLLKGILLALFASGLILFFVYLFWQRDRLSK